jgi:hypothetical protein
MDKDTIKRHRDKANQYRGKRKRWMATITVACDEHGPHACVLSSSDDIAWLFADFLHDHLPFEAPDVRKHTIMIYDPSGDEEEMPF